MEQGIQHSRDVDETEPAKDVANEPKPASFPSSTVPSSTGSGNMACTFQLWPSDRTDEEHAFFHPDGEFVKCALCVGKGRAKGHIKMRRKFDLSRWNDHCFSIGHADGLETLKAERKIAKKRGKEVKTQLNSNMLNYFKKQKKKKPLPAPRVAGDASSATDVIDADANHDGTRLNV